MSRPPKDRAPPARPGDSSSDSDPECPGKSMGLHRVRLVRACGPAPALGRAVASSLGPARAGLASRGSWPVSRARNPARPRERAVQAVEGRAPSARSRSRICGLGWRGPRSPSGRASRGLGAPLHVGLGRRPPLHASSGMTRLGFPPPSRRTGGLLLITFILYTREGPRHACPTSHLPRLQLDYFSALPLQRADWHPCPTRMCFFSFFSFLSFSYTDPLQVSVPRLALSALPLQRADWHPCPTHMCFFPFLFFSFFLLH